MGGVLSAAPLNLVDLLFYLQGFEVIELGLMGLEFGMKLVFARLLLRRVSKDAPLWRRHSTRE
jgi:hypothetical protein